MRILYMGTAPFAVLPLRKLHESGHEIVGVVTMPDKPQGRGHKFQPSAVKLAALELGLPVLQPENLKSDDFIQSIKSLAPDLGVVVAFRMLPEKVWAYPKYGTINLHGSLLPDYRGAAPINHAIINGDKMTGVTTFRLTHEIDTGEVLLQASLPIHENDTFGEIYQSLEKIGSDLLVDTIAKFESNEIKGIRQDELIAQGARTRPAPKIFKENCLVDWKQPAKSIHNLIRGLSPIPSALSALNEYKGMKVENLKLVQSEYIPCADYHRGAKAGEIVEGPKHRMEIVAGDGNAVAILRLKSPGKKEMNGSDFLNGLKGLQKDK